MDRVELAIKALEFASRTTDAPSDVVARAEHYFQWLLGAYQTGTNAKVT